jgi:hypothetical protein
VGFTGIGVPTTIFCGKTSHYSQIQLWFIAAFVPTWVHSIMTRFLWDAAIVAFLATGMGSLPLLFHSIVIRLLGDAVIIAFLGDGMTAVLYILISGIYQENLIVLEGSVRVIATEISELIPSALPSEVEYKDSVLGYCKIVEWHSDCHGSGTNDRGGDCTRHRKTKFGRTIATAFVFHSNQ